MPTCTEFAVFEVKQANLEQALELSESLFAEINSEEQLIIKHEILQKTDNPEEVCWHLTWKDEAAVEDIRQRWQALPSAKAIEDIVGAKYYYGHFVAMVSDKSNLA